MKLCLYDSNLNSYYLSSLQLTKLTWKFLIAETKERIVANLANFAYDPYNYTFLRQVIHEFSIRLILKFVYSMNTRIPFVQCKQLNVLELFVDCITEPNERLVEFGIGGICNACAGKLDLLLYFVSCFRKKMYTNIYFIEKLLKLFNKHL